MASEIGFVEEGMEIYEWCLYLFHPTAEIYLSDGEDTYACVWLHRDTDFEVVIFVRGGAN